MLVNVQSIGEQHRPAPKHNQHVTNMYIFCKYVTVDVVSCNVSDGVFDKLYTEIAEEVEVEKLRDQAS